MPTIAEIIETSDNDDKIDSIQATPTNLTEEKRDMATNIQETSIQGAPIPPPEEPTRMDYMIRGMHDGRIEPETFRLRAEVTSDVLQGLLAIQEGMALASTSPDDHMWLGIFNVNRHMGRSFPDAELTFEAGNATLDLLREWLGTVIDGHVMVESLDLAADYTGERYYNPYTGEENRTAQAAE